MGEGLFQAPDMDKSRPTFKKGQGCFASGGNNNEGFSPFCQALAAAMISEECLATQTLLQAAGKSSWRRLSLV